MANTPIQVVRGAIKHLASVLPIAADLALGEIAKSVAVTFRVWVRLDGDHWLRAGGAVAWTSVSVQTTRSVPEGKLPGGLLTTVATPQLSEALRAAKSHPLAYTDPHRRWLSRSQDS